MKFLDEMLSVGKYVAMAMFVMGMATACSSDDDDASLDTPEFEESAAKYVIEDNASPYSSIELTASGNYLIQQTGYSAAKPARVPAAGATNKASLIASALKGHFAGLGTVHGTRSYSEILYGKYTKTGDDTYYLEGFGTMTITSDASGNAYSLVITPNGGAAKEYTAKKQNADLNSDMSNKLCRTWSLVKFRMYMRYEGETLFDETDATLEGLVKKIYNSLKKKFPEMSEDEFDFDMEVDAMPEQVIFTKSGTYVVYYTNSELAVSTWKWGDESKGILRYSWNPDSFDDEYESGDVKVEFKGGQLHITEEETEYNQTIGVGYIFDEVR